MRSLENIAYSGDPHGAVPSRQCASERPLAISSAPMQPSLAAQDEDYLRDLIQSSDGLASIKA